MTPHFIYGEDLAELSLQEKLLTLSCSLGTLTVMVFFAFQNISFLFSIHCLQNSVVTTDGN